MGRKTQTVIWAIFTIAIFLLTPDSVSAADYMITVTDNLLTKNQDIIFEERNIGPGFQSKEHPVIIENLSSYAVNVDLVSIAPANDPNTLLPGVNIIVKHNDGSTFFNKNIQNSVDIGVSSATCIPAGATETAFLTGFNFDRKYGNEYQGASFKIKYTFLITTDLACEDISVPSTGRLVSTSESRAVFSFLSVLLGSGMFCLVFFLSLIWKRKKRQTKEVAK